MRACVRACVPYIVTRPWAIGHNDIDHNYIGYLTAYRGGCNNDAHWLNCSATCFDLFHDESQVNPMDVGKCFGGLKPAVHYFQESKVFRQNYGDHSVFEMIKAVDQGSELLDYVDDALVEHLKDSQNRQQVTLFVGSEVFVWHRLIHIHLIRTCQTEYGYDTTGHCHYGGPWPKLWF